MAPVHTIEVNRIWLLKVKNTLSHASGFYTPIMQKCHDGTQKVKGQLHCDISAEILFWSLFKAVTGKEGQAVTLCTYVWKLSC